MHADVLHLLIQLVQSGAIGVITEHDLDEPHRPHRDAGRRGALAQVPAIPQTERHLAIERAVEDQVTVRLVVRGLLEAFGDEHHLDIHRAQVPERDVAGVGLDLGLDGGHARREVTFLQLPEGALERGDVNPLHLAVVGALLLVEATDLRVVDVGRLDGGLSACATGKDEFRHRGCSSRIVQSPRGALECLYGALPSSRYGGIIAFLC